MECLASPRQLVGRRAASAAAPCVSGISRAPLLLRRRAPSLVVTQQSSAPTQTQTDVSATEAAMRAAKDGAPSSPKLPRPAVLAEAEDLKAKFAQIQAEVVAYKGLAEDNTKLEEEVARLRQENEGLQSKLTAQQQELVKAIDAARVEATGPMQQQLEELAMQLQNSQVQLTRLGEAVEAAESDKAVAVKALQEENRLLLEALAGSARRLSQIIYPAGSLPSNLSLSTRLEGAVLLNAQQQQQQQQADGSSNASTSSSSEAAAPSASSSAAAAAAPAAQPAPAPAQQQQQAAVPKLGFFGWLLGVVCFWLYQILGALLLYYAAAILRGAPPTLNLEFGLGCLVVSSVLPFVNRLLTPSFA